MKKISHFPKAWEILKHVYPFVCVLLLVRTRTRTRTTRTRPRPRPRPIKIKVWKDPQNGIPRFLSNIIISNKMMEKQREEFTFRISCAPRRIHDNSRRLSSWWNRFSLNLSQIVVSGFLTQRNYIPERYKADVISKYNFFLNQFILKKKHPIFS